MNLGALAYRWLDSPRAYRLVQELAAPGGPKGLHTLARDLVARRGLIAPALDVGCGPRSTLEAAGLDPIGLDVSWPYVAAFSGVAVAGSADRLPFAAHTFRTVFTLGLLHHLDDDTARGAVREMVRVCAPGGSVVVVDAVLPVSPWRSPYVYLTRVADRGRHMRQQTALESLLPDRQWNISRHTYSAVGHEVLVAHLAA